MHVATSQLEPCCLGCIWMLGAFDKIGVAALVRMRDQPADDIDVVTAVVGHLRHWTGSIVEVARQPGRTSLVFRTLPGGVVLLRKRVCVMEPCAGLDASGWRCRKAGGVLEDCANHGGEKRRLRTREVVSAIGVEHCAVVLDFEKKVIDDAFG